MHNNFNKRFEKDSRDFDRDFELMRKWSIIGSIFTIVISLGMLGFFIWVIIMLLRFFGVI